MSKLTLIASDFDSLELSCLYSETGTGQYISNTDCPIARAAKRAGYKDVQVDPNHVDSKDTIKIKGHPDDVERCREELLAGATEAYIEILD
jgi:hypothetical protein